jgi:hypothetical protein
MKKREAAYLLTEALVYIGLVLLVLGAGYAAMSRCIDNSIALRRNADDLSSALHAGERWRADVRSATTPPRLETTAGEQMLYLSGTRGEVAYRFSANTLFRRRGAGVWSPVLTSVKTSAMQSDARQKVIAWRWELELQGRGKGTVKPGRVRPLFTFLAVPSSVTTK